MKKNPNTTKVTINISSNLYHKIKEQADLQKITVEEFILNSIAKSLR